MWHTEIWVVVIYGAFNLMCSRAMWHLVYGKSPVIKVTIRQFHFPTHHGALSSLVLDEFWLARLMDMDKVLDLVWATTSALLP